MSKSENELSLSRIFVTLAALIIILAGMRWAVDFLNPLLFALVMSLIFSPLYGWLRQRNLPSGLALLTMLGVVVLTFGLIFYILSLSVARLSERVPVYAQELDQLVASADGLLDRLGAAAPDMQTFISGDALAGIVGTLLAGLASLLSSALVILFLILFFVAEGPAMMGRLRAGVALDNAQVARLKDFGAGVSTQFGIRAIVNLVTGTFLAVMLWLLGVDFALLWGVLVFFLSYIPYLGILLASIPPLLLAFLEHGWTRALLVVVCVAIANVGAENLLAPALMSRGLNLSPTVVFVSFIFWIWLLGAPGAFLAMPLTILAILMLGTFPSMRWLTSVMTVRPAEETE